MNEREALSRALTSSGATLAALSEPRPLLVVFLRHAGCTFCREALADIARDCGRIESRGVGIALVHMGPENPATRAHFAQYGLDDLPRVSDPDRELYRALGLGRGTLGQLFGLKCWLRGFRAGVIDGHWVGKLVGDGFQMPGVFVVERGVVTHRFVHRSAADRPDYQLLACAPIGAAAEIH